MPNHIHARLSGFFSLSVDDLLKLAHNYFLAKYFFRHLHRSVAVSVNSISLSGKRAQEKYYLTLKCF